MADRWIRWADQRPTDTEAVYRWRVSPRAILGLEMQPEWSDRLRFVGMGYDPNEWWPPCSDWNGYRRTVDPSLEWRIAEQDESEIHWKGLDLLPSPFTGISPRVAYVGRWIGAPPYLPESLSIESYLVRSHGWRNAAEMAKAWNRRPAALKAED